MPTHFAARQQHWVPLVIRGDVGAEDEGSRHDLKFEAGGFGPALFRVKAARAAIDAAASDVTLTARTEGFLRGRLGIDETLRRLKAFADAGADCLYAPGIETRAHIEATVKAIGGKPINFLNSAALGFGVSDLSDLGVRRISVGGALSRVAMDTFMKSARAIACEGRFDSFANVVTNPELNALFSQSHTRRA